MARVIQVLFYTTMILSVYGQQSVIRTDSRVQETEDRQRLTDLINLSKLFQTATRLAHPITTGINKVVGNIMDTDNHPNSHRHDSYERYPNLQSRTGNINRNRGRKRLRGDLHNQRRMGSRDATRRRQYQQTYYDYDYEYDDDYYYDGNYDSLESYDSLEARDEFVLHNSAAQSNLKSKGPNTKGVLLSKTQEAKKIGKPHNSRRGGIPLKKSNLQIQSTGNNKALKNNDNAGNNNSNPKIIYVFLKPGDIKPENNNANETNASDISDEDYSDSIKPRFAPLDNNPVPVNSTSGVNIPLEPLYKR